MNYANTKIYKLVCNKTGLIYIGSTTKKYLSDRLSGHRRDYEFYLSGTKGFITSFEILKNGDYDIILLESCDCKDKDEQKAKERFYIETMDCVNKQHPGRTKKEWYELNRERHLEKFKNYNENNKEAIKEYKKEYHKTNAEKIKQRRQVETQCDLCNGKYLLCNVARHNKTKKHMDAMNAL